MPNTADIIAALELRSLIKPCTFPPEDCPKAGLSLDAYCDGCLLRAALQALIEADVQRHWKEQL